MQWYSRLLSLLAITALTMALTAPPALAHGGHRHWRGRGVVIGLGIKGHHGRAACLGLCVGRVRVVHYDD